MKNDIDHFSAKFKNVTKTYGDLVAVQDLNFEISSGITGLIGPNGAGKTTAIKLLLGLTQPDSGDITILGKDPVQNPPIRKLVGWCPEDMKPIPWLTPRQYLSKMLQFYEWKGSISARVTDVAERFNINFLDRKNRNLSFGMRQRVKLARCFIHQPEFVILDEPLQGLDIVMRDHVRQFLREYIDQKKAILYVSHLLFEVEQLCEELIFLYNNYQVAKGSVSALRRNLLQFPLRIRLAVGDHLTPLLQTLVSRPSVQGVSILQRNGDAGQIEVNTSDPDTFLSEIASILLEVDAELRELRIRDTDLKSLYDYLQKVAVNHW